MAQFTLSAIPCPIFHQNIDPHFNEITYICHCPRNAKCAANSMCQFLNVNQMLFKAVLKELITCNIKTFLEINNKIYIDLLILLWGGFHDIIPYEINQMVIFLIALIFIKFGIYGGSVHAWLNYGEEGIGRWNSSQMTKFIT